MVARIDFSAAASGGTFSQDDQVHAQHKPWSARVDVIPGSHWGRKHVPSDKAWQEVIEWAGPGSGRGADREHGGFR